MILLYKLNELEISQRKNDQKIKAINSLKKLLLKLNFEAEEIPEHSLEKTVMLLESIKKEHLTENEHLILKQVIKKK